MKDTFLSNNNLAFINKLKESFNQCKSFYLSVSFIKKAGLQLIEREIEDALDRGVEGKIITSTYQNFTDIPSLEKFLSWMKKYPNFQCHLDFNNFDDSGFHSKGYIFINEDYFELIIGSTNITRFALLKNVEWNVSLYSNYEFSSFNDAFIEYDKLWSKTLSLSDEIIDRYKLLLDYAIEKWDMDYFDPVISSIRPNSMQRKALKEIRRYRDMGVEKALVIAATGSGKTYLAAFDAKNFDAKKLLFIVHRDTILNDAMESFKRIFGASRSYGLFNGNKQDIEADFVFASNSMLSRHLDLFASDEFDYLCIDECHHASAETYKKIMSYFTPAFTLGLTATPERMDNQDILELFEKNVPFELRLRDAIINDLVVPFHYYGIRDYLADYSLKEKNMISREIARSENVEFIASQVELYKPVNKKLKAIAFCTSISHANTMAEELSFLGYTTTALNGSNNLGERIKAFKDLQDDDNPLQIICAIDILNEGVDIPQINMVLFLRPTESSTIFLQQLGRGLRKFEGKEYLTVLDFIGNNYDRSVQIAYALGTLGNSRFIEKKYLQDLVQSDFKSLGIPGIEIFIEKLSKEEIIKYIRNTNFNRKDILIKDFENFKTYIGAEVCPTHIDFINSDCAPDLLKFIKSKINNKKNKSYYSFLNKIGVQGLPLFNDNEVNLIDSISDLLPLSRPDEYLIIKMILNGNGHINNLIGYNNKVTIDTLNNAYHHLEKDKIVSYFQLNISLLSSGLITYLKDLIEYGLTRCNIEFGEFDGQFKLYANYYKEQIMKELLEEASMFMKGTKFYNDGTTYVFVGLKKDKDKTERTNYKDKFISKNIFQWESENDTLEDNAIGIKLLNTKLVHLFVRKMDEEDGITLPFTYFGTGSFVNMRKSHVDSKEQDGNIKRHPTLLFDIILNKEVAKEYWFDFEIPEG